MIQNRVVRAVVAAGLIASFVVGFAGVSGAAPEFVALEESLALDPPSDSIGVSRMVVDPTIRRGYVMFRISSGIAVRAIDLDSLTEVAFKRFSIEGDIFLAVVDEVDHRLLIPYNTRQAQLVPQFGGIKVLDSQLNELQTFARPPTGMGVEPLIAGISLYSPNGKDGPRKILILFQDRHVLNSIYLALINNPVWVAQWDALTGAPDWPAYRISACRGPYPRSQVAGTVQQFFRSPSQNAIFIGCVTSDNSGIAVRINLDTQGAPTTEDAFPGPAAFDFVMADPVAERIIFVVERESDESLFFFETSRSAYLGAVGITKRASGGVAYAVAPETGRIYAITQDLGILLIDTRRTPPPQALTFPQFAAGGGGDLVVDRAAPGGTRVFVRPGVDRTYSVYRDTIPVSEDPDISELDRFTAGVAEQAGVTAVNFEGTGHSYGIRVLLVGGTEGVLPGTTREYARRIGSPCMLFDRELVAGLISGVALSHDQAFGGAVAADGDPGSKTDLAEPVSRCWPHPDPFGTGLGLLPDQWARPGRDFDQGGTLDSTFGREWPFQKVECSGRANRSTSNESFSGFVAEVGCDDANQKTRGFAQARGEDKAGLAFGAEDSPLVTVVEATSTSRLERMPGGGVRAITEAWSRGIEIGGIGTIELVSTKAVSEAAGRAGTAQGEFERRICGARIGTFTQEGCGQPELVIEAINRALGARGRARLPEPDANLKEGSPGGYLASVQKDRFEELSSRSLNNDFSTQVPGLEIVLLNDHPMMGRARQVFQFAGVDASTTYGVFLLTQALPPLPPIVDDFPSDIGSNLGAPTIGSGGQGTSEPPPPRSTFEVIIEKIAAGVALTMRSPTEAALTTVVLLTLAAPAYMAFRRRRLVGALGPS